MTIKNLDNTPFQDIIKCFLSAFKKYFVEMPTDPEYYKARWKAAKVRYDLSYGMFDGDRLTGFIINGIDHRNGDLIAFNTGTGVLPEYRGKRIVKTIYAYAIPDLMKNGITKCALEVIQENEIAVKSYKSIGFTICRHYACFSGQPQINHNPEITLKELKHDQLDWDNLPKQEFYSWDHHKNSIREADYRYFQLVKDNIPQSYFVIKPENGYVAQFDLLHDEANWHDLFAGIKRISETATMNNIDMRLQTKLQAIQSVGLTKTLNQYEMELILKNDNIA